MFASPAYAAATGTAANTANGGVLGMIVSFAPIILIFLVGYFLFIRPQNQRMAALRASVAAVKKGDSVITAGGVAGKVTKVEDQFVEVEIAANVRVRIVKSTLSEVLGTGAAKPAND